MELFKCGRTKKEIVGECVPGGDSAFGLVFKQMYNHCVLDVLPCVRFCVLHILRSTVHLPVSGLLIMIVRERETRGASLQVIVCMKTQSVLRV